MTPAERERAISHLEASKIAVLDATSPLNDAQWRFKPAHDQWSAAECVEHLAIVEARLLHRIQKDAARAAGDDQAREDTAGKEDAILQMVPFRQSKNMAPDAVLPANRFETAAALLAHFIGTRDKTIHYIRETTDPIRKCAFPHMFLGLLDGYQ